jgi:hypothetical protein
MLLSWLPRSAAYSQTTLKTSTGCLGERGHSLVSSLVCSARFHHVLLILCTHTCVCMCAVLVPLPLIACLMCVGRGSDDRRVTL